MLEELKVKNVALIHEAELSFQEGLNIITGETGAGKSILIDSIMLALGRRADKMLIRQGAEHAYVELVFLVREQKIIEGLLQLGVSLEDERVTLTRRVEKERSICRINGEVVSARILQQAAQLLIDIHGQQENITLLKEKKHLEILDLYCGKTLADVKEKLADAYSEYTEACRKLEEESVSDSQKQREMDLASFELGEINEAQLSVGEDEELEDEFRKLSNADLLAQYVTQAQQCLDHFEDRSALTLIGEALKSLRAAGKIDTELDALCEDLLDAEDKVRQSARWLGHYLDQQTVDEGRLYEVGQRLDLYNRLKQKYGNTVEEILAYGRMKQEYLDKLADMEQYLAGLKEKAEKAKERLDVLCEKADAIRRKKAPLLEKELTKALLELGFSHAAFQVEIRQEESFLGKDGSNRVSFLISLNAGESMRPLTDVASGGELSRIMLALKSILASADETPTLIFDEVDAGISGQTAWKVAEKMAVIGKHHQLLCITHLPQIAAMADAHFRIEKNEDKEKTVTKIDRLDEEGMTMELARLLGSDTVTDSALENARELKEKANVEKAG